MILIALGSNMSGPWGTPQQSVQHALQALQKTVPNNSVYGPKGQPAAVSVSRSRAVS